MEGTRGQWSVEKKDIPRIAVFMPCLWNMVKTFWKVENANDDYWNELMIYANELYKQFEGEEFCKAMIIAFVSYMDKKAREGNKHGKP